MYSPSLAILVYLLLSLVYSSKTVAQNLIDNGDFEQDTLHVRSSGKWSVEGMRGWGDYSSVRLHGRFCGLPPRSGYAEGMVSIYGNGVSEKRSYLQAQLLCPLVIGEKYIFSMWIGSYESKYLIDSIQVAYTDTPFEVHYFDTACYVRREAAVVATPHILRNYSLRQVNDTSYTLLTDTFTATDTSRYVIIGNLRDDKHTRVRINRKKDYLTAYFFIDDISLMPLGARGKCHPDIAGIAADNPPIARLDTVPLADTVYTIEGIYFDFDKWEVKLAASNTIAALVHTLQSNPTYLIELQGYADTSGDEAYNLKLSARRAEAVATYLSQKGIAPSRIKSTGMGKLYALQPDGQKRTVTYKIID
jgi:OmpA-OmpF porin, OOP family